MQKLIIRFMVALVTLCIGISISPVFVSPVPNETKELIEKHNRAFVGTTPEELPPPAQETNTEERSDLSIVIEVSEPDPNPPSHKRQYIKLAKRGPTIIDLDLGEGIDNQEVALNLRDNSIEYRMFQRYRTSMTISAEGPHLDLINWRHFDSPWIALQSLDTQRFRTLATDQMEYSKFPETTRSEIIREVRRQVGNDWPALLELVEDCRSPNDGACLVSISSIYLRIQKKVKTGWIDVGLVEVRIPMGC